MGLCYSTCQNRHATTHVLLAKKTSRRPNGGRSEKIDARQTKGLNFASATKATPCDSPDAYCLLRLALCVQQMWERGISEAAQRPATRKWKFKGGKQILIAAVLSVIRLWSRCSLRVECECFQRPTKTH